jgi:hypothetical protein
MRPEVRRKTPEAPNGGEGRNRALRRRHERQEQGGVGKRLNVMRYDRLEHDQVARRKFGACVARLETNQSRENLKRHWPASTMFLEPSALLQSDEGNAEWALG